MDAFRQWTLCVIIAAAAGTFACALSPRGATDKTVRAVVGIFVVCAICAPLSELDFEEITLPAFADSYNAKIEDINMDEYILSACTSTVESEIMLSATEYGIAVEGILVDAEVDENKCVIIHSVCIKIPSGIADYQADFLKSVEKKLGVPVTID